MAINRRSFIGWCVGLLVALGLPVRPRQPVLRTLYFAHAVSGQGDGSSPTDCAALIEEGRWSPLLDSATAERPIHAIVCNRPAFIATENCKAGFVRSGGSISGVRV